MRPPLTVAQRRIVDHNVGTLVARGPARSGRTTALLARWHRLVEDGADPARIGVVCRDARAAAQMRGALLSARGDRPAQVNATSVWALAFATLDRRRPGLRLLSATSQRALAVELLQHLGRRELLSLSPVGMSEALVAEIADFLLWANPAAVPEALANAGAVGHGERWAVAAGLVTRYRAVLAERGLLDASGLLEGAAAEIVNDAAAHTSLLVDDPATGAGGWGTPLSLVAALCGAADDAVVCAGPDEATPDGTDIELDADRGDLRPSGAAEPARRAVVCHHPSIEGEAVTRLVLDRLAGGADPADIVVVARQPERAERIARALGRHGVAAHNTRPSPRDAHLRGLVGMLHWVAGDDRGRRELLLSPLAGLDADTRHELRNAEPLDDTHPALAALVAVRGDLRALADHADVARVAHEAFIRLANELVPEPGPVTEPGQERALAACVAFVDGLLAQVQHDPELDLNRWAGATRAAGDDVVGSAPSEREQRPGTVLVAAPDDLRGTGWATVIVGGGVEGELPRVSAGIHYLDRALLSGPPATPAFRRAAALAAERRLFADLERRADREIVVIAPLEPGVLMSRFVTDWECTAAVLPDPRPVTLPVLAPTTNGLPLHPDGTLRLSASQLDRYDECALQYLYEYTLRVKGDANIWADFGSLVHDILEEFVGPDADETDLSWERLLRIAEDRWTDEIAEHRPQREELRRDLMGILEAWYAAEGSQIGKTLEVLCAEREFRIQVGAHTVSGRIDRIDRADDGVGTRILDYKTSKQAASERDVVDNLQLRLYHLAALRDPELAALGPPTQLRLLFLRGMKVRDQDIADDHEEQTVSLVEDMATRILAEHFEPTAGDHCRRCTVRRLCPLWPEGREAPLP